MYESLIYVVTWLVRNGYSKDIIEALSGENSYSSIVEYEKLDVHSRHLRHMSILHLEYLLANKDIDLNEYPNIKLQAVTLNNKVISSFLDHFNAWNLAGFPGISIDQLNRLASDKGYKPNLKTIE